MNENERWAVVLPILTKTYLQYQLSRDSGGQDEDDGENGSIFASVTGISAHGELQLIAVNPSDSVTVCEHFQAGPASCTGSLRTKTPLLL